MNEEKLNLKILKGYAQKLITDIDDYLGAYIDSSVGYKTVIVKFKKRDNFTLFIDLNNDKSINLSIINYWIEEDLTILGDLKDYPVFKITIEDYSDPRHFSEHWTLIDFINNEMNQYSCYRKFMKEYCKKPYTILNYIKDRLVRF